MIAGKSYPTSLYSKIKIWSPVWPAQHPKKNENKNRKFYLDRRQKVKGQHKGPKKLWIFIPQNIKKNKKGLKASELNQIEGFSKCWGCCCCGCGGLNEVVWKWFHIATNILHILGLSLTLKTNQTKTKIFKSEKTNQLWRKN